MDDEHRSQTPPREGVTRRRLLLGAAAAGGVVGAAAGVGGAAAFGADRRDPRTDAAQADSGDVVDLALGHPFYGTAEQAGIHTPQQRYCVFMTFSLTSPLATDLQVLLARWSASIAEMMEGRPVGQVEPTADAATGDDTGEALDLGAASLTVTIGLGPKIFRPGFGLERHRPPLLRELRHLPSDNFERGLTGGDLSLQACADDPQVAYHAIHDLARIARNTGSASTLWTVIGFGRASAGRNQMTPRNLMGFKDGTRNLKADADFDRFVWVKDGPAWQRHGTYQVVRKIQMQIENWDSDRVSNQNQIFGRHKVSGAPLSGTGEFDTPDFHARDPTGQPVISPTAHISLAAFEHNGGLRILRRGYNYSDGINQYGQLDAGLLFISYQDDPAHFETLQEKLGASDQLNEYISHIGSGIFFVPPAPPRGSYVGEPMFRT
jgi:deferrochelatase/peroxidase EfeB